VVPDYHDVSYEDCCIYYETVPFGIGRRYLRCEDECITFVGKTKPATAC